MNNIKAIIFDFDNTLADRTKATYDAFYYLLSLYAPELKDGSIEKETVVQDLMIWDQFGNYPKKFVAENLEAKYGIKLPFVFVDWWSENQHKFENLFPDTIETLTYLRNKGYKLGVITNGNSKSQNAKLNRVHISDYVDSTIVCGDYDFQKPEKVAFDFACKQLGVKNEEAVYVGDIYSNDVTGAARAGLTPIWIWPDGRRLHNDGVKQIAKISELIDLF